ncbi:hypothetical protein SPBR_00176 [Sporothrix brasiliensis 5110]|uniref:Zn(2)-C6 fungal-type domain-containing protein n=1 Tax=Sporothrix brasiliensis 5110 TaxID=1398154 RepID=A0A0C2FFA8_9PEZI|nr:uncharacterized protein SPBR_00176 [Sporothrix brasiliensis 5110]KIH89793.1 hypothetical protein SPBR_00176 [Sporothrix brasiliensis 5110]
MSQVVPVPSPLLASLPSAVPSQSSRAVAATGAPSEPRVLACVMCQQRKVKCNRKFPCNNCIRLGVSCVPATLNPRRRRRRFPERELLDHVRRCEALLRQNHVRFDSLFEEAVGGSDAERDGDEIDRGKNTNKASHDAASSLAALRRGQGASRGRQGGRGGHGEDDSEMVLDSDGDEARVVGSAAKAAFSDAGPSSMLPATTPTPGTEVERRAEANNFWKAIRKGFHDPANGGASHDRNTATAAGSTNAGTNNSDNSRGHVDGNSSDSETESEIRNSSSALRQMWARQLGSTGSLFFRGPHWTLANVTALHPGPVQIFRLWQIYLQNVDPLLKITHTPSLQGQIVEATSNLEGISPNLEALLFSIYCVAVHSMSPSDCQTAFGTSKDALLATYQPACEQALLNSGFLRTSERDCLAAFFLYLISLGHSIDPRSLYAMLGVAMRVAQTMQINNEVGPGARLAPLEAEMRRRLWWAMALFDSRISELANHSPAMLDPTWDCRLPLNANDFDFRPELKEPPVSVSAAGGRAAVSSEALFAVVRSELGNAMRHAEYYLALSNPALKCMARDREYVVQGNANNRNSSRTGRLPEFAEVNALEDLIEDKYLQYCDPANGLHYMTIWMAKGFIAKCRLIKYFSRYANGGPASAGVAASTPTSSSRSTGSGTPSSINLTTTSSSEALRDCALADALTVIESDTNIMTSPLTSGYRWLLHLYFPLPAYIFITQELASRIGGARATHAWVAMNDNYEARFALSDSEDRYMFKMFASTILQAWDACEARSRASGKMECEDGPVPLPQMIVRIRAQLAEASRDRTATEIPATTDITSLQSGGGSVHGNGVSGALSGAFATTLSMDLVGGDDGGLTASLFSGPPPPGSGAPSAFGDASPPAPPLFTGPNFGAPGFGLGNMGNWPQMPMPWGWGPRPPWGG